MTVGLVPELEGRHGFIPRAVAKTIARPEYLAARQRGASFDEAFAEAVASLCAGQAADGVMHPKAIKGAQVTARILEEV